MNKVLVVLGTRPEAIKQAPVIRELRARAAHFETVVCATAQHREMQDQALEPFGVTVDHDLDVMEVGQSLDHVVAQVLIGVGKVLEVEQPDWVLVQGDTSTAFAAGLSAFHNGVRVGHVEAGLRTGRRMEPFPEEVNRRMVSTFADLHFAPTDHARDALIAEGIDESTIVVTGNTVIDSLHWILDREYIDMPIEVSEVLRHPTILVTAHRRESFGSGFDGLCTGIARIAEANPDHRVLYPVHLNPRVREPVLARLGGIENVVLTEPMAYLQFVHVMKRVSFIISDSGGVQEEATALAKPVLVMRDVTERPEAVAAGVTELVGTDPDRIFDRATALIADGTMHERAAESRHVYGDGKASARIADALLAHSE